MLLIKIGDLADACERDILDASEDVLMADMRPEERAMMSMSSKLGHLRIADRNAARARDELVRAMANFDRSVKDPQWLRSYPIWKRVFIIDCKTIVEKVKKLMIYCTPRELDIMEDAIKTGLTQRLSIPAKDMHVVDDTNTKKEAKKEEKKAATAVFET